MKPPVLPDFARAPSLGSPIFWHFAWRAAPWTLAMVGYLVLATFAVRWDMARAGEVAPEFGADLYGMYTQLFFEPTLPLPHAPVARAIFWITPVLGGLLFARGVLRIGASLFDVEERRRLWVRIMIENMNGHIIVCGLGNVGVRVVESLKALGSPVVAIEQRRAESFASVVEVLGVPVVYGDVRRDEILIEAGIERARAVVCATDDDLANLEVAIDAKRMNPAIRVVMRMFDKRLAGKMRDALDVDETFSASALAGPLAALQASEPGVVGVYQLDDGSLRVDLQIDAPPAWWGHTVERCEDGFDGRVIAVRRGATALARVRHDTKIAEGDTVMLDVPAANLARVRTAGSG